MTCSPTAELETVLSAPDLCQETLAQAFAAFTQAAHSLERSYAQLQNEIGRLRVELQQANAELEREREAARKLQALAEVSTLLAHEIRNPLGSMELFASLLANGQLSEEQNSWIGHIQAGLRTLAATVNNVLQFHAESAVHLVETDVGEVLHWAFEFLGPLARQAGAHLRLRNQLTGARIPGDAHCLQQIILNLVLNALQALPEGGEVVLAGAHSGAPDEGVQLEVSDNGHGIDSQHLQQIFEAGFSTRSGSAGLGLAVCRKLVEQHGGEISVTSTRGQGTTFRMRLPGGQA